jgi:UDP-3-O-[3-hydroxymyristoyl] glucosamine N-acyltransferase
LAAGLIGPGVLLGDNCKVQNYALVCEPAVLEAGVFIGPAVVLANDVFPRAVTPDGALKTEDDWDKVGVTIRQGTAIGARAVCIAPVTIGAWATVARVPLLRRMCRTSPSWRAYPPVVLAGWGRRATRCSRRAASGCALRPGFGTSRGKASWRRRSVATFLAVAPGP